MSAGTHGVGALKNSIEEAYDWGMGLLRVSQQPHSLLGLPRRRDLMHCSRIMRNEWSASSRALGACGRKLCEKMEGLPHPLDLDFLMHSLVTAGAECIPSVGPGRNLEPGTRPPIFYPPRM